ncbi:hypothetical protein BA1DRAFT_03180 [Photorhabdus aegyptia]|uniref:Uncharacterized protein n=1 Tax=Photorhabdus aegyptia TaxID=2805098 RepID=A0A022PDT6_9GAMM|nr:hypothetical protein BA1DRAFT_03180 [Photorhabdus aegyptia]
MGDYLIITEFSSPSHFMAINASLFLSINVMLLLCGVKYPGRYAVIPMVIESRH